MAVKIILSDIDGTFLRHDKSVPDLHAKAAKEIVAQGKKFVLVSARMPEAIYPITDGIGLPRIPVISYSGALVLTETEEVLHDKKMPAADTAQILAEMDARWQDISINYYTGRKWYVRAIDKRVQREIDITQATAEIADFDELQRAGILPSKILVMCEPLVCEEMERELQKFVRLNVVRSAPHLLEVMDKSVSKAVGIEILLKHYGLTVDEAIAFGDNYNDIEMLEYIPQSVAMGNAPEKIREIAGAVTDSSEDSGIYTYLVKAGVLNG